MDLLPHLPPFQDSGPSPSSLLRVAGMSGTSPRALLPRAVAEARITCQACPWQAEGRIWDGPWFYCRIRSGQASLGFGVSMDEAIEDGVYGNRQLVDYEHGGEVSVPWCPTDVEAWALFDLLLAMRVPDSTGGAA